MLVEPSPEIESLDQLSIAVRRERQATDRSKVRARKLIERFNTWAFKREHPSEPERLLEFVSRKIGQNQPLSLVLYWGKGPRAQIALPDTECLDYLGKFRARIESGYEPGCQIMLCLTDTHARHNGHSDASIQSYFDDINQAARDRGFETELLSELVDQVAGSGMGASMLDNVELDELTKCAAKWYRGSGSAEQGARQYLAMNMIERRAVEQAHLQSIFVTYNGSRYRGIFPEGLPVFYMYSLRKGTSVKPWFMDAQGEAYSGAEKLP